ncbi:MAG: hypothetical protein GXP63_07560 [DPANN group archaeon]|nr:hypothetical protein [DPANN group archaeon]
MDASSKEKHTVSDKAVRKRNERRLYLLAAGILLFLVVLFMQARSIESLLNASPYALPLIVSSAVLLAFFLFLILFFSYHRPIIDRPIPPPYDHSTRHALPSGLEREPKSLNIHEFHASAATRSISQMKEEHAIRHLVDYIQAYLQKGMTFSKVRKHLIDSGVKASLVEEAHRRYAFYYRRHFHQANALHPKERKKTLLKRMPKIKDS